jgi:hypothetical protein
MIVVVLITAGDGRQQQCRAASQKTMSGMRWLSLRVQLCINAACLIDDEQAEACNNAVSLLCNRGSRLDAICLSDMVGDGGLAASIALPTSCHIESRDISHHAIHEK